MARKKKALDVVCMADVPDAKEDESVDAVASTFCDQCDGNGSYMKRGVDGEPYEKTCEACGGTGEA